MKYILDCENKQSAIDSLRNLFNCSTDDLISSLLKIDLDSAYKDIHHSPNYPPDEFVYKKVRAVLGEPTTPEYICWFHLTRTFAENNFADGILPLGKALDGIWEKLLGIFEGTEHYLRLQDLKRTRAINLLYQSKTTNPSLGGPSAMLVRDVAFGAKSMGNHDYLRLPEILEDICNGYREKYGLSIHNDVVQALKPCIVKFKSKYRIDNGCFKAALFYVRNCLNGDPPSVDGNTCFDARGNVIPNEDILSIEYLKERGQD